MIKEIAVELPPVWAATKFYLYNYYEQPGEHPAQ